jgi:hypothetical protein
MSCFAHGLLDREKRKSGKNTADFQHLATALNEQPNQLI